MTTQNIVTDSLSLSAENPFYMTATFFDESTPQGSICGGKPAFNGDVIASYPFYFYSCWVDTSDQQSPAYAQTVTCGTMPLSSSSSSSCSNCASSDDLDKT